MDEARAVVRSVDAPGLVPPRATFADGARAAWFVTDWVDVTACTDVNLVTPRPRTPGSRLRPPRTG